MNALRRFLDRFNIVWFCLAVATGVPVHAQNAVTAKFADASPVERTWLFGTHKIGGKYLRDVFSVSPPIFAKPNTWFEDFRGKLREPDVRHPAIIFAHGCTGMNKSMVNFWSDEGYAVFAPNSFIRPGRQKHCRQQGGTFTYQEREEEIAFALSQLQRVPWIDKDRIFLVGHSEGGQAVSAWSEGGFAAIIITGNDCKGGANGSGTPQAPGKTPVLAVTGLKDTAEFPPCSMSFRDPPSEAIVVRDAGHDVYKSDHAQQAMRAFLEKCCGGAAPKRG